MEAQQHEEESQTVLDTVPACFHLSITPFVYIHVDLSLVCLLLRVTHYEGVSSFCLNKGVIIFPLTPDARF